MTPHAATQQSAQANPAPGTKKPNKLASLFDKFSKKHAPAASNGAANSSATTATANGAPAQAPSTSTSTAGKQGND
jgi:hypothetical protein